MSQTLHDSVEKGYATRIADYENGEECVSCKNIFSTDEKVYRINKKDDTIIQCTSLLCFREQGGEIDEYQINTIIGSKKKTDTIPEPEPKIGITSSEYDKFCTDNYLRIKTFREWIKKNDPVEAKNGQSLGLSLNQLNNQWIQEKIVNN